MPASPTQESPLQLTKYFDYRQLTRSDYALRHGIDNNPPPELYPNLVRLARGLEDVRFYLRDQPIIISSGYRSLKVNAAIGGVPARLGPDGEIISGSYHLFCLAADFTCPAVGEPIEVARRIAVAVEDLGIDKLILEYGNWVHIQFPRGSDTARHQVLTIRNKLEGYVRGLVQ